MAAIAQVSVKEYDTMDIGCEYLGDNGSPISLDGIDIFSDIKSMAGKFKLVASFTVTINDVLAGKFTLTPNIDHIDVGFYQVDILFVSVATGQRISSETFRLNIASAITAPRP